MARFSGTTDEPRVPFGWKAAGIAVLVLILIVGSTLLLGRCAADAPTGEPDTGRTVTAPAGENVIVTRSAGVVEVN